jgi:transposase-like protein
MPWDWPPARFAKQGFADHLKEIYAVDVSPELISRVTDEVKELAAEWRGRALEPFYPVLFLDALRVNIRDGATVAKKSVYLALAIRLDGQKELLGLWIEQNEGARFWMGIMNELKTRGVQDMLLAAVDGLTGFPMPSLRYFPRPRCSFAWYTWSATRCGLSRTKTARP